MKKTILINSGLKKIKFRYGYSTLSDMFLKNIKNYTNLYNFIIVCENNLNNKKIAKRESKNRNIKYIFIKAIKNKFLNYLKLIFIINIISVKYKADLTCSFSNYGLAYSIKPQTICLTDFGSFVFSSKMDNRSFLSRIFTNMFQKLSVINSKYLIFSSKFTADFYIKNFKKKNFNNYKIAGCSFKNFSLSKRIKKENSVLFIGGFFGLKNQKYLIDFFLKYEKKYKLYLAGVDYDKKYYNLCEELSKHSDRIILIKSPSDAKLRELYNKSKIYISPSFFEGFSMTPMEALSANSSIVLSNIKTHKEIYGKKFLYFNPKKKYSLKKVFNKSKMQSYNKICRNFYLNNLKNEYSEKNFVRKVISSFNDYFSKI